MTRVVMPGRVLSRRFANRVDGAPVPPAQKRLSRLGQTVAPTVSRLARFFRVDDWLKTRSQSPNERTDTMTTPTDTILRQYGYTAELLTEIQALQTALAEAMVYKELALTALEALHTVQQRERTRQRARDLDKVTS